MRLRFIIVIGIMEAMEILYYLFGLFLLVAGLRDLKNRKVEDLLSSFMWLIACAFGMFHTQFFTVLVYSFAILYAYNSVLAVFKPKWVIGWADILILPLFLAFLDSLGGKWLLIIGYCGTVLITGVYLRVAKSAPYVMVMAVMYLAMLIYWKFAGFPG